MTLELQLVTSTRLDVLDRSSPLQQQIFLELRAELVDGLWVGREDFYTEKEVSERFDVSPITSRSVLDRLEEDGWIRRSRGRRAIPIRGPDEQREPNDVRLVSGGRRDKFEYDVIFADVRVAPAEACRGFGRPLGSRLWQCSRLRSLEGQVHSVTLHVQEPALGGRHDRAALERLPMPTMLHKLGEHLSVLRRRVAAVSPPPVVAQRMGLKLGTPTLLYTCTVHRKDGSVVEWLRVYLHPEHQFSPEVFDLDADAWIAVVPP